jgi:hypothetical protein
MTRRILWSSAIATLLTLLTAGVAFADGCACGSDMSGAAAGGAAAAAGLVAGAAAGYGAATATKDMTGDCAQALGAFNALAAQRAEVRGRLEGGLRSLEAAYNHLMRGQYEESELLSQRNQAFALLGTAAALSGAYLLKVGLVLSRSYAAAAAIHARQAQSAQMLWQMYGSGTTFNVAAQQSGALAMQNFAAARTAWTAGQAGAASVGLAATIRAYLDGGMADYYASVERNKAIVAQLEQACRDLDTQMHGFESRMHEMRPRLRECGIEPGVLREASLYWPSRVPGPGRI